MMQAMQNGITWWTRKEVNTDEGSPLGLRGREKEGRQSLGALGSSGVSRFWLSENHWIYHQVTKNN